MFAHRSGSSIWLRPLGCFMVVFLSCSQGNLNSKRITGSADFAKLSVIPKSSHTDIDTTLHIVTPDGNQSFTLEELKAVLKTVTMITEDIVYNKTKTYEGFWLMDLLKHTGAIDAKGNYLLFRAADGYEARLSISELMETQPRGLIAFRDVNAEDLWEKFQQGQKTVLPAPYYLVWGVTDKGERSKAEELIKKRPWPYQLIWIEVIDLE